MGAPDQAAVGQQLGRSGPDAALEGRLVAPRCTNCGTFVLPPRPRCFQCQHTEFEWVDLPGTGTVYSFTVVRQAPGSRPTPYSLAYVDLEDGVRVMKQAEIRVRVVLNRGAATTTVWTCDLSHDYVSINADYRS